ncbi:MAG: hypothetical protein HYX32_05960 [Actinobacteria bacterium]|nr:hypothetical protein [Actinomycetota bacterium]
MSGTDFSDGELRQRDLQRSALLRSVTHDLRTPLSAIRAVVSDLHDGVQYDELTRIDLLETVLDEIDRLDRLVGNLLAASRIEAGAMEPRAAAVAIEELLEHRVRTLGSLLREHVVALDVPDGLPEVEADYGQIEQVVTNLLTNAVRYAPTGSTIEVDARVADDSAGRAVRVAVRDRGPGMPSDFAARAFEPFVKGVGSRSTGLGLSICKAIVEAHGGQVGVDARRGGGTAIWFTLPVMQPLEAGRVQMGEA